MEYCFQVPANRIGHHPVTAAQLKTIQEVIILIVFCPFPVLYLKEELKWKLSGRVRNDDRRRGFRFQGMVVIPGSDEHLFTVRCFEGAER